MHLKGRGDRASCSDCAHQLSVVACCNHAIRRKLMAATVERERLWPVSIDTSGWRALAASWMGWMFDGYETYALVLVMGVAVRDLLPPDALPHVSVYMGGLLAVTLLGWAAGGVIAGVLADYIGRKRMLMISILWYAVFAGLAALSRDYWFLLTFRFFTG